MRALDPAIVDNAVQLYVAGKTIPQVSAETGIGMSTLSRELRKRGIETRGLRKVLPVEEIVAKYCAGVSELALSKEYGLERRVIRTRLEESGVHLRGQAEAIQLFYSGTTRAQRQAITAAANAAVRGKSMPEDLLAKQARGRQRNAKTRSAYEEQFAGWLTERDIPYARETAIGRYNVDFALGPVAVEILGGEWHSSKVKRSVHGRRTPYILNQGWAIAFVWTTANCPWTNVVVDEVMAFVDEVGRDPSLVGEYRVIRGDGKLLARGRTEDYERTGIVPARHG